MGLQLLQIFCDTRNKLDLIENISQHAVKRTFLNFEMIIYLFHP